MSLDKARLSPLIRDAARQAFGDLRRAHPDEAFYAFALTTDEGGTTVVPAANSEEGFRQATLGDEDPADLRYARQATPEWRYEASSREHFAAATALLNASPGDEEPADQAGATHQPKGEALLDCMVEGLRLLDAEGFFGASVGEREKITLFVSISDCDEVKEVETSSARQLNPPGVAAAFARRYE